jgi:glycosyltransferase involved in cell wall biosynthesis
MAEDLQSPFVSVIIAVHNAEGVLPRCLSSLAAQSWRSFEVVLVDDGSTDGSVQVALEFDLGVPLVLVQQPNAGAPEARNSGARTARGTFLVFLDSDDAVHPEWLDTMAAMAAHSGSGVACCAAEVVDPWEGTSVDWLPKDLGPAFYSQTATFLPGAYCVSSALFLEVGGFEDIGFGEHHELGLRLSRLLAERGLNISTTSRKLVTKYHDRSPERIARYDPGRLSGARFKLEMHAEQLARDPALWADYHAVAGVAAVRLGMPRDAQRHFARAARLSRWRPKHLGRLLLSHVPGLRRLFWRRTDWLHRPSRR